MRSSPHCAAASGARSVAAGFTLALAIVAAAAAQDTRPAKSTERCLFLSAENLARGPGNWFAYVELSAAPHVIAAGDLLEYDIFLPALNPVLKGGVDLDFENKALPAMLDGRPWLRDSGLKDAAGLTTHGDAILEPAKDHWFHRSFDLSPLAGVKVTHWTAVFEGDAPGRYVQLLASVRITNGGQTAATGYGNGAAPAVTLRQIDGYSRTVLATDAPRDAAISDARVAEILEGARARNAIIEARAKFRAEMDVARDLAHAAGADALVTEIDAAAATEDNRAYDEARAEAYLASLHDARERLTHAHTQMRKFTGHLVGHAHIDLQWLWSWDETVQKIIPETFGQAVKFMKEFPEFTFSQSSAALYLATEQNHPQLFADIQKFVAEGRWELVGGRWSEGDTNMISAESHARHFLYGQRYFQSRFGRTCTVGWEPDTFGHTWTMPQLLKKAGIDSYYFCRGGKDIPLFWWESPDGSRVLAFDEPATGGWYNDVVNDAKVKELAKFVTGTHALDHLMVYGVGNHGGGPTREYIEAALAMKNRGLWPDIKFSTASEFFARLLRRADELQIKVVKDELNPIFEGCYTTHSRIKRYNRDSEALLVSAEAAATAVADLDPAAKYPRDAFEDMWRDVLWSHHHDTLPGSFIHASALYSAKIYDALIERAGGILGRARRALATRVGIAATSQQITVFNPLAWSRDGVVDVEVLGPPGSGTPEVFDSAGPLPTQLVARRTDGDVDVTGLCFRARAVPGCGMKAFGVRFTASPMAARPAAAADPAWKGPRPVILHEKPHGMSAWTLGAYASTKELERAESAVVEDGLVRRRVRETWRHDKSTIVQDTITYPGVGGAEFETNVDWLEMGDAKSGNDLLKVAIDSPARSSEATFAIPFGHIRRQTDGHEDVMTNWCDLSGQDGGTTVLNDCKHAADVQNGTIRLTLVRSSYDPDPTPDIGRHRVRYAIVPHGGALDPAVATRAAAEFNQPLEAIVTPAAGPAGPTLPGEWAGCSVLPANVVVTGFKRAEDGNGTVIRAYECAGQRVDATIALGFRASEATEVDLVERPRSASAPITVKSGILTTSFAPFEIRTFLVK